MSITTLSVTELTAQLEAMKLLLKEAKQATKPKTAVSATLHTAKDSGKLSICVGQGFRKAYLNADQVNYILMNRDMMMEFIGQLK